MKSGTSSHKPDFDLEEVYIKHVARIYNFFRYRVGNDQDAEDLTATTFAQAWRNQSAFNPDRGKAIAWLFGISRRRVSRHYRKKKALQFPSDIFDMENAHLETGLVQGSLIEDIADHNVHLEKLHTLLSNLPDRDQELLAMKYGTDMTNREIAKITGLSETNVGTILHRATVGLRAEWGEK